MRNHAGGIVHQRFEVGRREWCPGGNHECRMSGTCMDDGLSMGIRDIARVDTAMQAENRHRIDGLGEAARHAQDPDGRPTLFSRLTQQRFGFELGAVIDGAWRRRECFVNPGRPPRPDRCIAIERRRARENNARDTSPRRDLQQPSRRIDIDAPEFVIST